MVWSCLVPVHQRSERTLSRVSGLRRAAPGARRPGEHWLLDLQRQVGNRAVTSLVLQRKLSIGPERIDEARSLTGQLKGAVTNDTLFRLRKVVADHQSSTDVAGAEDRLILIQALCFYYRTHHDNDTDSRAKMKLSAVDDIYQAARVEESQLQAQSQYLKDLYAKKEGAATETSDTRFSDAAGAQWSSVTMGAKSIAAGTPNPTVGGANKDAVKLARRYGLTEAEIAAIRLYTVNDYAYINPATANNRSWMEAVKLPKTNWPAPTAVKTRQMRPAFEEGALHGAMATALLVKLPSKKGTCYRGERLTPAKLDGYRTDPSDSRPNITSVSLSEAKAQEFTVGGTKTRRDQTVSALWQIEVTDGKDIASLSLLPKEEEWNLLPGTRLQIKRIEELGNGVGGNPPATKWVKIYARQVG